MNKIKMALALTLSCTLHAPTLALASVVPATESQKLQHFFDKLELKAYHTLNPGVVAWEKSVDPHLLFQNRAEAVQWANDHLLLLGGISGGAKTFQVLDNDPQYAALETYVQNVWTAYTELYPEETKGLNVPPVVLIKTEAVNAFVASDPVLHKIPHAIFVFTGLLDTIGGVQNSEPLYGVIAHEMAHSVFRHILSEYQERINKFYNANKVNLGYQATPDQALDAQMENWLNAAELAGDLDSNDLLDLPSPGMSSPLALRVLSQIRTDFVSSLKPSCWGLQDKANTWYANFQYSGLNDDIELVPTTPSVLAPTSQALISSLQTCLKDQKKTLIDLLVEMTGIPAASLQSNSEVAKLAQQFDQAPDLVSAVQTLVHQPRQLMQNISKQLDFSNVGYYSYEEHADDNSAITLAYLGLNPLALNSLFALIDKNPNDVEECLAMLTTDTKPPMGAFSEPHHSDCYRMQHLEQLKKVLPTSKWAIKIFAQSFVIKSVRP